jgi:hypothetical protein
MIRDDDDAPGPPFRHVDPADLDDGDPLDVLIAPSFVAPRTRPSSRLSRPPARSHRDGLRRLSGYEVWPTFSALRSAPPTVLLRSLAAYQPGVIRQGAHVIEHDEANPLVRSPLRVRVLVNVVVKRRLRHLIERKPCW